jgi:hypothetical protein
MKTTARTKYWPRAVALFASLIAASMSSPALAITVQNSQVRGEVAEASWFQGDSCTSSSVFLFATESATPSGGSASAFAFLNTFTQNICTGAFSFSSGSMSSPDIQFSGQKTTRATLTGTIPTFVCEFDPALGSFTCGNHTVAVNMNWTGNNDVTRSSFTSRFQFPGGMFMSRTMGSQATATALGSIIQDDTVPLVTGDSQSADIISSKSGQISISHP